LSKFERKRPDYEKATTIIYGSKKINHFY